MDSNQTAPIEQEPQPATNIGTLKIFGVGDAGLNVLELVIAGGFPASAAIAVNSEAGSLAQSGATEKVQLETRLLRGLGSGGDPERGRAVAQEHLSALKSLCAGTRTVAIIAGLGGGSGTGISPVLAKAARDAGALTLAFAILPFECEGNLRRRVAEIGLEQLREAADIVITLPNQKTLTLINEGTSLVDVFKTSNAAIAQALRATWNALTGKSVMGLPFTDLCRATRPHSSGYFLASAEAAGPNRVPEIVERLYSHPMIAGADPLPEADSIAVCLIGGPTLAMVDVNRVMEKTQEKAQGAPILMGAVIHPDMTDRLAVLLLVGRSEFKEDPAGADTFPASCRAGGDPDAELVKRSPVAQSQSRFVPPPPTLSPEQIQEIRTRQSSGGRSRKIASRLRQTQLPLEIVSRGRFDKSEPTIHKGEDLDVPTYIRRGVSLN